MASFSTQDNGYFKNSQSPEQTEIMGPVVKASSP
jgi:hypothetical protein